MTRYALLANPGHNRVYFEESKGFMLAELSLLRLSSPVEEAEICEIGGIAYVTFSLAAPLTERDIALLARLSFFYALFELQRAEADAPEKEPWQLLPLRCPAPFLDYGISGILKYTGKTNEVFTRMMIGIAAASCDFDPLERLRLLDPIAGKGTTLFEGLCLGYDAAGVEIGDKVTAEAYHFFKRYLETAKYKHTSKTERVSGPGRSFTATHYLFDFARSKEEYKTEEGRRSLELFAGDSRHAASLFKKNSFHLLVGDLPYGVQHGNVTGEKQSSLTRNPKELLKACLPGWKAVLKTGGVLALSWNVFVFPREQMLSLLESQGFAPCTGGAYDSFEHRVDQAIKRDIVIAKKA